MGRYKERVGPLKLSRPGISVVMSPGTLFKTKINIARPLSVSKELWKATCMDEMEASAALL